MAAPSTATTSSKKTSPKTTSKAKVEKPVAAASSSQSPAAAAAARKKMSPSKAASKVTVNDTPTTEIPAQTAEPVYSKDEIEFFQLCLEEESMGRISSTSHLAYYITRGPTPASDVPEGFVYREGLARRAKEIFRLQGIVSSANKDPVDYKDHGVDKSISRADLRRMMSDFIAELRSLASRVDHGLTETKRRDRAELKERRVEDKVREGRGLLTIRKEIMDVLKGNLGKSATFGDMETKKTRTGLHKVRHYKFTNQNLDAALFMFRRNIPTVRSTVVNLIMRYLAEKNITMRVSKRGDNEHTFSMPKEFTAAYKSIMKGSAETPVKTENMISPEIQRLISHITVPYTDKPSERDEEDILTDVSLVEFARNAARERKEAAIATVKK